MNLSALRFGPAWKNGGHASGGEMFRNTSAEGKGRCEKIFCILLVVDTWDLGIVEISTT